MFTREFHFMVVYTVEPFLYDLREHVRNLFCESELSRRLIKGECIVSL